MTFSSWINFKCQKCSHVQLLFNPSIYDHFAHIVILISYFLTFTKVYMWTMCCNGDLGGVCVLQGERCCWNKTDWVWRSEWGGRGCMHYLTSRIYHQLPGCVGIANCLPQLFKKREATSWSSCSKWVSIIFLRNITFVPNSQNYQEILSTIIF